MNAKEKRLTEEVHKARQRLEEARLEDWRDQLPPTHGATPGGQAAAPSPPSVDENLKEFSKSKNLSGMLSLLNRKHG